jgi:hypothetical protein
VRSATVETKDFHVSGATEGGWEPLLVVLSVEARIAVYQGRIVMMRHRRRVRMKRLSRTGTVKMRRLNQAGCRSMCVM